jgi:hypothetical protein
MQDLRHEWRGESTLEWSQVNAAGRLIPAHLIYTFGPATYAAIREYWAYGPHRSAGVVPVNQFLRFVATGARVRVRDRVETIVRWGPVVERRDSGKLGRAWLLCDCTMRRDSVVIASGEFWMALTRPFAPAAERRIADLPTELARLGEIALGATDLPRTTLQDLALDRTDPRVLTAEDVHVFHLDRTDSYHHVNTVVYAHLATDAVARRAWRAGLDVARLEFRDLTMMFRKPFFAGETADVDVELLADGAVVTAVARFTHRGGSGISAAVRMGAALVGQGSVEVA